MGGVNSAFRRLADDWEFNVLGIYNYRNGDQFRGFFRFLAENHDLVTGDICEVGVFQGSSLLATALFLKEIGSNKKVYGFDSFAGFPHYDDKDQLSYFKVLADQGAISPEHFRKVQLNIEYRKFISSSAVNVSNISSSGDFSATSSQQVLAKAAYLKLDNIELLAGAFKNTMVATALPGVTFSAVIMDCDLYQGYADALPFVWKRLNPNGFIHFDEYYSLKFPGGRLACNEFFKNKKSELFQLPASPGEFERWACIKAENDG